MKLANFTRLDPSYEGVGLKGGGRLEEDVWTKFYNNCAKLARTVAAIRATYALPGIAAFVRDSLDEIDGTQKEVTST
ncbi:MAG: hypothetical protein WKF91_13545 [Segetibacter sp.]